MRKLFALLLVCLFAVGMTACVSSESIPETTLPIQATQSVVTEEPPQETIQSPTQETTQPPTETLHSPLYIPGLSVEDVILYFNEVALDAEFVNGGDPSRLQKWTSPILYQISGTYTEEDIAVLDAFAQWLNTIEGFPGIDEAQDPAQVNLRIYFCDQQEMVSIMGDDFGGMDGAVTFWYLSDEIYDAVICYRNDISQVVRNSVILEEIYNGLGPVQDTDLRQDSIIYSGYSEPQSLTAVDELILRLLYHPFMECGMDRQACEQIIRDLYY